MYKALQIKNNEKVITEIQNFSAKW